MLQSRVFQVLSCNEWGRLVPGKSAVNNRILNMCVILYTVHVTVLRVAIKNIEEGPGIVLVLRRTTAPE